MFAIWLYLWCLVFELTTYRKDEIIVYLFFCLSKCMYLDIVLFILKSISWEKKILHLVYALRKLFPVKLLLLTFIAKTCTLVIMYILYNYGMKADNSEIMVILVKFSYVVVFYPRLNVCYLEIGFIFRSFSFFQRRCKLFITSTPYFVSPKL